MAEKRWIRKRDRAETGAIIAWAGVAMFFLGVSGVLRVTFLGVILVIVGIVVHTRAKARDKKESVEGRRSAETLRPSSDDASSSAEKRILEVAKGAGGVVTPADIAVNSDIDLDRAEEILKALVARGHCEIHVRKDGNVVYTVPSFLTDDRKADIESAM